MLVTLSRDAACFVRTTRAAGTPKGLVDAVRRGDFTDGRCHLRCTRPEALALRDWLRAQAAAMRPTRRATADMLATAAAEVSAAIALDQP